ncbi:MAG: FAD:protein FMN transferase [Marinobacter sp.]|nr:FAD:protein FMN transferase [Marinobacter sp.]
MTNRLIGPALVAMTLVMAALAGCSSEPDRQIWEISGGVFGTEYHISVVLPDDQERLKALSRGITRTLDGVDASMSTYRKDSELSRFNQTRDQSDWFPVSEPMYRVLADAQRVSRLSDGAFDITIGPVVNLWGFGPDARPDQIPDDQTLAKVLAGTGYEKLTLREHPPAIRASSHQYLDLSGIAKGYGVDAVARYLTDQGVNAYLVEIGGEVRVRGRKPDDEAWRLAIEQPVSDARKVNRVVILKDRAMATSGDYRNYYESNGHRYSHTINPETGRPITHNLASVSVITDNCTDADALATAFDVMGYEKASALATRENIAVYFIVRTDTGFETHYTPAFTSYITNQGGSS